MVYIRESAPSARVKQKQPPALELHSELTHRFQWKLCYMQCGPLCRTQYASSNVTAFACVCFLNSSKRYSRPPVLRRTNESQTTKKKNIHIALI